MSTDQPTTPPARRTPVAEPSPGAATTSGTRRVGLPRRVHDRAGGLLRPVAALGAVVAGWWLAVEAFDIAPFFLPAPPDIVDALAQHRDYLLREAWATIGHTLGGFIAAAVAGTVAGLLLSASGRIRQATFPLLVALQAVPKVAVAPLLVVWLGFGPAPKVALVTLLCLFPVVVNTLAGLSAIPAEADELARSLTATRWQTLTKIRIWYALPQTFVGLKVAMSLALIGAVVAQITVPNSGLGAIIVRSGQAANTPLAFAAITLLAAIGIGFYYTLVGVERLVLPWARATTA